MGRFGMGQAVHRTEDRRFVTGTGRYTDDIDLAGQSHAYILRSPHAHARILSLNAEAARQAPGILAVLTAEDLAADGLNALTTVAAVTNRDGSPAHMPPWSLLAEGKVRYVGDAVALIVAETPLQARDAAELIAVDYETLPAIADTGRALDPGATPVWDGRPDNLCFDWELGDGAAVAAGFATAAHVVDLDLVNNRVVVASMEPRAAIGAFDAEADLYTLHATSQGAHSLRAMLAKAVFGVPEERIRVITPDVGGGFGMKLFTYPEYALVLWAARRLGRPVKWASDRGEAFLTDTHGRDHLSRASLALDAEGRFLALRVETTANLGAYLSNYAIFVPTLAGCRMLAGVYRTPAIHVAVQGVFTNTTPVDAYRGAGRPEAAYLVERLVDKAARQIGLEPEELRRRNFIRPADMPFTTALALTYDSGDFAQNMEDALRIIDKPGLPARKQAARARGKLLGLGIATYIEQCGGGADETATLRFDAEGRVTLLIGTQSTGQGHETAYAQIIAEGLDLPFEKIKVVQGDTGLIASGRGTGGSRSLPVGGAATRRAVEGAIERGREIAAHLLEAAPVDIDFAAGRYVIGGTDRGVDLDAVIRASVAGDVPAGTPSLDGSAAWGPPAGTFPNGCHACEVEIDPETGAVAIVRYVVVDDFGTVVNPLLLAGQVHGGVAQGVGQALHEHVVYDPDSGQPMTGSLMDYTLPRADHLPMIEFSYNVVPCATNLLGVKGAGEAGAIGAPPAIINALVDAMSEHGIDHIDMPATPLRIWEALRAA